MAAISNPVLALQADLPQLQSVPAEETEPSRWPHLHPDWRWGVTVLAAGLALIGGRWWTAARMHISTDNAFVAGNVHQIAARLPGTVAEILISDNQAVSAGEPLLKLDSREFDLRVEQARNQITQALAQIAQAKAQLDETRAKRAQAEARSAKAAAELQRARLENERGQHLTESGRFAAISKQEVDALQAAFEVAQAAVQLAQADVLSSSAAVESAEAAAHVAQAQHRTAQVNLADAELQRSYTVIVAPVSGTIGHKAVEAGQRVQSGQALLAIVAPEKWIVANFKETQIARMRAGQPVSVRIDALPGLRFPAHVESFSPASGAQFALLPPDNATGNFTKIVQRVPVKIVFDRESVAGCEGKILPGLSATAEVALR